MECRPKRSNTVNKHGSVSDSRPSRNSFRIRKRRKQKATQTEDINFSSSTSTSATSESCTSSSDDEQQTVPTPLPSSHPPLTSSTNHDRSTNQNHWHLRKPSSLKHRKAILSDSNDDYYYTHPPSPQQPPFVSNVNPPAQQLIPRGPLICSDSFEKWNDRYFTCNRVLPLTSTLPTVTPSHSTETSESASSTTATTTTTTTTTKTETSEPETDEQLLMLTCAQASFYEGDVTDDDDIQHFVQPSSTRRRSGATITKQRSNKNERKSICLVKSPPIDLNHDEINAMPCLSMDVMSQSMKSSTNFGSSQNLYPRKLSPTESLHSLPNNSDQIQNVIFERLRQAVEVSWKNYCLFDLFIMIIDA
jgi:hypothetical protein